MFKNIFIWLSKQLYPDGRAFRVPEPVLSLVTSAYTTEDGSEIYTAEDGVTAYTTEDGASMVAAGGILHRLHEAIGDVQSQTWSDAISVIDSTIADNPNFTIDDANAWYRRLGIYNSGTVPLADMMQAINQKINYPGETVYGRSHYLFIQAQLRLAGFDVYVYENRFPDGMGGYITKTPSEVLGVITGMAILGLFDLGDADLGGDYSDTGMSLVVNYIEEYKDNDFSIGDNYRSTFFVAGSVIGDFAEVPLSRKIEFRQLILQLKPAQTVGILFINYV